MIALEGFALHGMGLRPIAPNAAEAQIDVGIAVHNALDDVRPCLASVIATRTPRTRVIVVDDGSDDATRAWLRQFAAENGVQLVRHEEPLGYTRAANAVLEESAGEYVVLLNSDTVVTPEWLERLVSNAMAMREVGLLGPLSNAASWQSVPEVWETEEQREFAVNRLPKGWSVGDFDFAVKVTPSVVNPRVPLINGFCQMLTRSLIDTVGYFDEERFPHGYGEENDYAFRAWDAGFSAVIAMDTYVFHSKSRSFGEKRRTELRASGSRAFRSKWGNRRINDAIKSMRNHRMLAEKRALLREVLAAAAYGNHGLEQPSRPVQVASGTRLPADLLPGLQAEGCQVEQASLDSPRGETQARLVLTPAPAGDAVQLHPGPEARTELTVEVRETSGTAGTAAPDPSKIIRVVGTPDERVRRVALLCDLLRRRQGQERGPSPARLDAPPRTPPLPARLRSPTERAHQPPAAGQDPYLVKFDATAADVAASRRITDRFRADPVTDLTEVTWFVPAFDHVLRGGIRTVFSIARDLYHQFGTRNRFILCADDDTDTGAVEQHVVEHFPDLRAEYLSHRYAAEPSDLPESGAAIATLWTTAYVLLRYNRCAAKFYLVQDWEPGFVAAGARSALIEQTYRFGFVMLANSPGVANRCLLFDNWVGSFTPGVDRNVFFPPPEQPSVPPYRVVFYGRPTNDRNGFFLGVEGLKAVKARFGSDVDIVSVGAKYDERVYGVEGVVRNLGVLRTLKEVADLYRQCHAGLVFMYTDHPSYQPLEWMASGCTTVTNFNLSNTWLLKHRRNCFLALNTVSGVAEAVTEMLEDQSLRQQVMRGGLETTEPMSWEAALSEIREYLASPRPTLGGSLRDLAAMTSN